MPAMLCLRRNEKLLDALLSLAEILRLVSYCEHVPYALLNPAHGRASNDPVTAARGSIPRLMLSALALLFEMYQKASCTVYFRSVGLTDFGFYLFAIPMVRRSQISTGFHRQ